MNYSVMFEGKQIAYIGKDKDAAFAFADAVNKTFHSAYRKAVGAKAAKEHFLTAKVYVLEWEGDESRIVYHR